MLGVERAQIGPVIWRVLGFSFVLYAAILVLITAASARDDRPAGKLASPAALPSALQLAATALARPTPAWLEFCKRLPEECSLDLNEPDEIRLTPAIWSLVNAVNRRVNASITPLSDWDHWKVQDRWTYLATATRQTVMRC